MARIAIVGAGALGLAFASILSKRQEVLLVCRREEQAVALQDKFDATVKLAEAEDVDFFILTTKAYDALKTFETIREYNPHTPVVAIQNGLLHIDGALRGVTTYAATRISDIESTVTAEGVLFLHDVNSSGKIAKELEKGGLHVKLVKHIGGLLWEKFFVNVGINALGAVTGKRNGELVKDKGLRGRMRRLVEEAVLVSGLGAKPGLVFDKAIQVARMTGKNKSSMLQDIEAGRKTEIDYLNGAVCVLGGLVGVETPENVRITGEIKSVEGTYLP
ncbi:MAG: 2-dehydropantoate 2-reductase [Candidatus Diapherotrites archaeon]|nr:2-dehydropantoate 2-reductase [Candidatus Diapherotrites archaeon]